MIEITNPALTFTDLDGSPLDAGSVYIGVAGSDPQTNPKAAFWDAAGTIGVSQPMQTVNGYVVRSGSPAAAYVDGDHSLKVINRRGETVLYAPNAAAAYIALQNTISASVQDQLDNFMAEIGGAVFSFDDVADMRANAVAVAGARATTRVYSTVKAAYEGGAQYYCDIDDTTSADNDGTVIVSADGGRWKLQVYGNLLPARQCGVYGDQTTGQTARVLEVITQARAIGKGVLISGFVLLNEQLVIGVPVYIEFDGADGDGAAYAINSLPQSAFVLPPTHPSGQAGVVVEHPGIWFMRGGIICALDDGHASTRYQYDGIAILAHGFRWDSGLVFGVGRAGFRIGSLSGAASTRNSSRTMLTHCRAMWCGDKGFHISDDLGFIDANTFQLNNCIAQRNINQGLYINKSLFGGTIIAFLSEHNGTGLYVEDDCRDVVFLGGDFELNSGPDELGTLDNIVLAGRALYRNKFIGVKYQDNVLTSTSHTLNSPDGLRGTYEPLLIGQTTAGTLAYFNRKGRWAYDGEYLTVSGEFYAYGEVSGNPTGHLAITLPELPGFEGKTYREIDPTTQEFSHGSFSWAKLASIPLPTLPSGGLAPIGHVYLDEYPPRMALYMQTGGTTGLYPVAPTWTSADAVGILFMARIPISLEAQLA